MAPTFNHIKGNTNNTLVLMHSGIVNRCQLLLDDPTVPEQLRGIATLFLFYSILFFSSIWLYLFVFVTLTVLFLFWGASIFCVYNVMRVVELVL